MSFIRNNLANLLTCLNLSCGFAGICTLLVRGTNYETLSICAFLVVAAGILDFFDGFIARMMKSASNIGKDLDSLADMVTFGLLPGVLLFASMYKLYQEQLLPTWAVYTSVGVPVFSAIRLAIFNNDSRQSDRFIGVPTPANALFISFLLASQWSDSPFIRLPQFAFPILAIVSSLMLVAPIPLIALKFKDFSLQQNWFRYLLIFYSLILLVWFHFSAIPLIILGYIALSITINWFADQ